MWLENKKLNWQKFGRIGGRNESKGESLCWEM